MVREEQQHRMLKATVALALYNEYGRVPKEQEIDEAYHKAVLGTHFFRKQRRQRGQLVLF